ncbi:FtsH protease activity modulator HflK [Nioella nitratireducens]|uniref:FtsH protease activity modulator HflK n=1 Tax=Nioella nitratireducens TaxID=1287720 RepID=UPI0008FD473D|nr:FtsH protease activity modulator HflK [Nioella nitratireducens]
MAGNSGGPWGGGGGSGGGGNRGNGNDDRGGRRPGEGQQIPEIDEIVRKGQEQLRVLMGGRGGRTGGGGSGDGPQFGKGTILAAVLAAAGLWLYVSVYTVRPEEQSVELFLGQFQSFGQPGLNFAPWPVVTAEVVEVTTNRTESIGTNRSSNASTGLMLTTDANIVDIDFEVVWNVSDPRGFLFNLAEPAATVRAVSESAMREVIAASQLAPILNRDRGLIADTVQQLIQDTLDSYDAGINIVRLNLDRADPPMEVIDAFRDVQAAEQERDRLQRQADAYANRVLAGARGEAAQNLEEAEGYRAQVVNVAEGEASRFSSVLQEYQLAPEVTRQRMYLETMESVLGAMDMTILDTGTGGDTQGVVPYLPLNELRRGSN